MATSCEDAKTQGVVDGRMDVATGDGVADSEQLKSTCGVVD